jgi:hypothetical protein
LRRRADQFEFNTVTPGLAMVTECGALAEPSGGLEPVDPLLTLEGARRLVGSLGERWLVHLPSEPQV